MQGKGQTSLCLEKSLAKNSKEATVLLGALLSHHGPLQRIVKYIYQYFVFWLNKDSDSAKTVLNIALDKMDHVKKIEKLIFNLGCYKEIVCAFPVNFSGYKDLEYGSLRSKMITNDLTDEMVSISEYEKILKSVKNEGAKAVIEGVLKDERKHAKILKEIINEKIGQKR